MTIELTEQQRRMVDAEAGRPIEVVDPGSGRSYMLVAREQFEKVRPMLDDSLPAPASPSRISFELPPGVLRSQEAFWRDLPELLKQKRLRRQFACYHGDERIGIAKDDAELLKLCQKRRLKETEFYVGYIDESPPPPWLPEEVEIALLFERSKASVETASAIETSQEIAPGIRRSQEAFWRDLPELLKQRKLRGRWVCYYGDEQVGISKDDADLFQRCLKRGLKQNEFYVGYIEERPIPPWEPEVLEQSLFEAVDIDESAPPVAS